jgi:hopanoid biosynthesis associated protein HpnK
VRRLIVNADDFGLTIGVNRAIAEAHDQGVVTSATLMATGAAFADAVERARSVPRLSVGGHIVLTDGFPLLSAEQIPTLTSDTGQFRQSLVSFALSAISGRINPNEIEAEANAQIRKLQTAGIVVSHIDTHKHTHIFPPVLRPLLRAARACGIRAVRNPFEPAPVSLLAKQPWMWKKYSQVKILGTLGRGFRKTIHDAGLLTPDGTIGIVVTGALDERLFASSMDSLPDGTWELVCHPGHNDAQLDAVQTRLRESRTIEQRLLTSPEARESLSRNGIELISYRDLA